MNINHSHFSQEVQESHSELNHLTLSEFPHNYYESLINLENKLLFEKNIETIETLINLYKIGIEYYSDFSVERQEKLMMRLHELLMDRKNLKIIDENRDKIFEEDLKNLKKKTNFLLRTTNSLNKKRSEPPLKKHTVTREKKPRPYFKSFTKIRKTKNDSKIEIIIVKGIIKQFHLSCHKAGKIIQTDLLIQTKTFRDSHEEKQIEPNYLKKNNYSVKKPIIRLHEEWDKKQVTNPFSVDERFKFVSPILRKTISSDNPFYRNKIRYSLKTNIKLSKSKKTSLSINEVFDDYLDKFIYIYFKNVGKTLVEYTIAQYNSYYINKINILKESEDKIKELEFLKTSLDENYANGIDLMLEKTLIEKEENLLLSDLEVKKNVSFFLEEMKKKEIYLDKLSDANEDLIENVLILFK